MKLPNGFGTVYKMQGNRRRPYVAKKTIQGKQKAIGYFETFEDAMACLVAYNRAPALLSPSRTTFSEVYALWKDKHFPQLRSESARISYRNSYRHCARLHSMVFVDIRAPQWVWPADTEEGTLPTRTALQVRGAV